jgi:hypothetical protein
VGSVQDGVGNDQALNRLPADDVRLDDFVHVFRLNASIPDRFRVNDHSWPQFALIQATGFVGADIFNSELRQLGLEQALEFALTGGIATAARVALFPLIHADKNMFVEFGHGLV